jgi:MFS family permease
MPAADLGVARSVTDVRAGPAATMADRERWWALGTLCLGFLMSAINGTAITVALPSIKLDLHFSEMSVVWVVNAYLVTYAGFLLLGGRLGDLIGHGRVFRSGIVLLTLASLGAGLATSPALFVAARSAMGLAGAFVSASALSLIMRLFADAPSRARALGVCAFVGASAGSLGLLLGGVLTGFLSWRWMFFGNVLVGAGILALCVGRLPRGDAAPVQNGGVDVMGAVTVTASIMVAVYALVNGEVSGWASARTLGLLAGAAVLLALFVGIESQAPTPLMPLALFRVRNVAIAVTVAALWSAALLGWSVSATLNLQLVLGLSPLEVGTTFLPAILITGIMSLGVAPILIGRLGLQRPLVAGLLIAAAGLAMLAQVPGDASVVFQVLPAMMLVGVGAGIAQSAVALTALSNVSSRDYGAASGIVSVGSTMGGALGLAALAGVAAARTDVWLASGMDLRSALSSGYRLAFASSAVLTGIAAMISAALIREGTVSRSGDSENERVAAARLQ